MPLNAVGENSKVRVRGFRFRILMGVARRRGGWASCWIVRYAGCWIGGQMLQGLLQVRCLENLSPSGACETPAKPRRISLSCFPPLFLAFSQFFYRCHGDVGLSRSEHGSRFGVWRGLQLSSRGMWNQSFSAAGLNITVSQDGPRCKSTRTAMAFFWLRIVENAKAATFVLFISTRSTDRRFDSSQLRAAGSGHLRLVSFDTKGVFLLPAGGRSLLKNAARLDFHGLRVI